MICNEIRVPEGVAGDLQTRVHHAKLIKKGGI